MTKNNYEIARGDYSSPTQSYESDNKNDVSSDTAQRYLLAIRDIVSEQIEKRIRDGQDSAQVYDAEITDKTTTVEKICTLTINDVSYDITMPVVTSVAVRYNDDDRVEISNASVRALDGNALSANNKWCKICTYDNVQFYVLHRM